MTTRHGDDRLVALAREHAQAEAAAIAAHKAFDDAGEGEVADLMAARSPIG